LPVFRFVPYARSDAERYLYVSEYPNSVRDCEGAVIADGVFHDKRTFLLLLDSVASAASQIGSGGATHAWRLDFYDHERKKYLDIKRNHGYTFLLKKIKSTPYTYPLPNAQAEIKDLFSVQDAEAWHNPGSNIEYTVRVEDDWANYNYSNGQYTLSVSTDTIRDPGRPFKCKAQIPAGVDYRSVKTHLVNVYNNGLPVGNPGTAIEVNGYATASGGINLQADGHILFLTFTIADRRVLNDAHLLIRLGNICKRVPIMPEEPK
jgi:hypothetical protein